MRDPRGGGRCHPRRRRHQRRGGTWRSRSHRSVARRRLRSSPRSRRAWRARWCRGCPAGCGRPAARPWRCASPGWRRPCHVDRHDRFAQVLLGLLGDQPEDDIGSATGAEGNHQANILLGIVGLGGGRKGDAAGGKGVSACSRVGSCMALSMTGVGRCSPEKEPSIDQCAQYHEGRMSAVFQQGDCRGGPDQQGV